MSILNKLLQALFFGIAGGLIGFFLVYIFFCGVNGWNWAIEISSTYILLIIRVIVVAFLAFISLLVAPFTMGGVIWYYGVIAFKIGGVIGFIVGLFIKIE